MKEYQIWIPKLNWDDSRIEEEYLIIGALSEKQALEMAGKIFLGVIKEQLEKDIIPLDAWEI